MSKAKELIENLINEGPDITKMSSKDFVGELKYNPPNDKSLLKKKYSSVTLVDYGEGGSSTIALSTDLVVVSEEYGLYIYKGKSAPSIYKKAIAKISSGSWTDDGKSLGFKED